MNKMESIGQLIKKYEQELEVAELVINEFKGDRHITSKSELKAKIYASVIQDLKELIN